MLDPIFDASTWKVALAALAALLASTYFIGKYNPKDEIQAALKGAYVSTDNPYKTERTLWYDTGRVTDMLRLYNEPEHYPALYDAHRKFILRHDLLYPLCYGIPGVILLAFLYPWGGGPRWLVLVPLAAMVFDYAENFTMLAFLGRFRANPQTPLALLELSRVFTFAKNCLILLSLALLVVFLVGSVINLFRARTAAH
ncbi:MAG TPA: hypothetical protein VM914_03625 [Pyrinomonadaceae bacterium]|jgi:hypothetical protein|nr:hypothetical protein [Pyrinomonadaceae bacterium]